MARENKKIDQVQYQELIESFKKLEDDRFPVRIDHSYGKGVIDSVRVTGHNRDRVRLFKEFARDAVTLFEIPCAGCEVEKWIRLVFEHVSKLAKRSPIGGGLIFSDDIHNAAEASAIAMRRLYAREANKEDISDIAAGTVSKTNNTTEVDVEQGRNATTKPVAKPMGWNQQDLVSAANISDSKFRDIRKNAQVEPSDAGGLGQQRRYKPIELEKLITGVLAVKKDGGKFRDRKKIAAKWEELLDSVEHLKHD